MTDESKAATPADETAKIGRGALYLTFTKLWFLVTGYVIVFGLPRILGDKALMGKYAVVTGLGAIINALVIQGTTQAVSRFVSKEPAHAEAVRRAAYRLQAVLGGGMFAAIWLVAPWIAENFWHDPELATPLRWAGGITLFYAFYAIFMGYLNGLKEFGRQALVDFAFSNMKVLCILLGAVVLGGTLGKVSAAVAGFATAAGVTMVFAFFVSGRREVRGHLAVGELLRFQVFTMAFTFVTTFIARADLQILKAFTPGEADAVNVATGDYYGAQQFSAIPYQLVFAITFVLFPLVSGAAGRDQNALRGYIANTTRYASLIAAIVVALFVSCPQRTITILFPPDYASASEALQILAIGYLFFSVFFIMTSIITASGRPQASVLCGVVVAGIQVGLGWLLVEEHGKVGVAAATSIGMASGFVVAHVYLRRRFGRGIDVGSFARTVGCAAAIGLVANLMLARSSVLGGPGFIASVGGTGIVAKGMTAIGFAGLGLVYLFLLKKSRVLTDDDLARLRKVLPGGKKT